jgi:hypothetical protein
MFSLCTVVCLPLLCSLFVNHFMCACASVLDGRDFCLYILKYNKDTMLGFVG